MVYATESEVEELIEEIEGISVTVEAHVYGTSIMVEGSKVGIAKVVCTLSNNKKLNIRAHESRRGNKEVTIFVTGR